MMIFKIILLLIVLFQSCPALAESLILPANSKVVLSLPEDVTFKTNQPGDIILLNVVNPVQDISGKNVLIEPGLHAYGILTHSVNNKGSYISGDLNGNSFNGRSTNITTNSLTLIPHHVTLKNGLNVPISGGFLTSEDKGPSLILLCSCMVLAPLWPVTLPFIFKSVEKNRAKFLRGQIIITFTEKDLTEKPSFLPD
jgi:hypothetical protein